MQDVLSFRIKQEAARIGFLACGVAQAGSLDAEARRLEQWLREDRNGNMAYMAEHFDMRTDPRKLVDGAKSVITVLCNYTPQPEHEHLATESPKISRYAFGTDYHHVIKDRLRQLLAYIETLVGPVNARVCVDSAPVMDKVWAVRAGLGWVGKHTNVIRKRVGSYFFIGEIILDLPLSYDAPTLDYCGSCRRCIDACPTQALTPYQIDARRCISYLTIELKEDTPEDLVPLMDGWAFGCDICQEVCPWNRFATPTLLPEFQPLDMIAAHKTVDWQGMTASQFRKKLRSSPLSRIRLAKWLRNRRHAQE